MSSLDFFHIITIHPPPCTPGSDTQGSAEAKPFWLRAVPGSQRKTLRNSFWSHPRLSPGICPGRGMGRGPCPTSPLCLIAKPVPRAPNGLLPSLAGCLCIFGTCDNRIDSDGACLPGTCREGSAGRFCHKHTSACGPYMEFCHIHATCEYSNGTAR